MNIQQTVIRHWPADQEFLIPLAQINPQLLLVFGSPTLFAGENLADELARRFPRAARLGCSTAGEIAGSVVENGSLVVTALNFARTILKPANTKLAGMEDSHAAGERLGDQLAGPGLNAVLVFGQGVNINGSALVDGMASRLPAGLAISGGLAGDDGAFRQTWVLDDEGIFTDNISAVGFYGEHIRFSHGCGGGWQAFGPLRKVTRSAGNVLYELDGEPALVVYKRYLGDYAKDLPASGLLFPFEMISEEKESVGLIRTILGVDEALGSLILAGEIDPTGFLRLMHAHTDRLVDGAEEAVCATIDSHKEHHGNGMALLVSCVGRKLVMGGRIDEEVEAVARVLGPQQIIAGFYSYGEISPALSGVGCKLHNQTMTITYIEET